jgi:hypothetical protein
LLDEQADQLYAMTDPIAEANWVQKRVTASLRSRRNSTSAGISCASAGRYASSVAIRRRRRRATPMW